MAKEEKKVDDGTEASQQEEKSFITIFFEGPGSAQIAGLKTQGVSLNQVALAAKELQGIADFEQWWAPYIIRMEQVLAQLVEQSFQKMAQKAEEEMVRRTLAQSSRSRPS